MDALSKMLRDWRLTSAVFSLAEFSAPWGFSKEVRAGAPFYLVTAGRCFCWDGHHEPIELLAGDMIVVPRGTPFSLGSSISVECVKFGDILTENGVGAEPYDGGTGPNRLTHGGGGAQTRIIIGMFSLRDHLANPLLTGLPHRIVIREADVSAGMDWFRMALEELADEVGSDEPGHEILVEKLADIIFIHIARHVMSWDARNRPRLLNALADKKIAKALGLIHGRPGAPWTLETLAKASAMSRTSFAARFRALTGLTPVSYLIEHRMRVASQLLLSTKSPIAEIASAVGYGSDVAFSPAFNRCFGKFPGAWRKVESDT